MRYTTSEAAQVRRQSSKPRPKDRDQASSVSGERLANISLPVGTIRWTDLAGVERPIYWGIDDLGRIISSDDASHPSIVDRWEGVSNSNHFFIGDALESLALFSADDNSFEIAETDEVKIFGDPSQGPETSIVDIAQEKATVISLDKFLGTMRGEAGPCFMRFKHPDSKLKDVYAFLVRKISPLSGNDILNIYCLIETDASNRRALVDSIGFNSKSILSLTCEQIRNDIYKQNESKREQYDQIAKEVAATEDFKLLQETEGQEIILRYGIEKNILMELMQLRALAFLNHDINKGHSGDHLQSEFDKIREELTIEAVSKLFLQPEAINSLTSLETVVSPSLAEMAGDFMDKHPLLVSTFLSLLTALALKFSWDRTADWRHDISEQLIGNNQTTALIVPNPADKYNELLTTDDEAPFQDNYQEKVVFEHEKQDLIKPVGLLEKIAKQVGFNKMLSAQELQQNPVMNSTEIAMGIALQTKSFNYYTIDSNGLTGKQMIISINPAVNNSAEILYMPLSNNYLDMLIPHELIDAVKQTGEQLYFVSTSDIKSDGNMEASLFAYGKGDPISELVDLKSDGDVIKIDVMKDQPNSDLTTLEDLINASLSNLERYTTF